MRAFIFLNLLFLIVSTSTVKASEDFTQYEDYSKWVNASGSSIHSQMPLKGNAELIGRIFVVKDEANHNYSIVQCTVLEQKCLQLVSGISQEKVDEFQTKVAPLLEDAHTLQFASLVTAIVGLGVCGITAGAAVPACFWGVGGAVALITFLNKPITVGEVQYYGSTDPYNDSRYLQYVFNYAKVNPGDAALDPVSLEVLKRSIQRSGVTSTGEPSVE